MNEDISKDPLYTEIMKNRCLTCYKEETRLTPLIEKRFLKIFVPEITLSHGDRVCEACDSMLRSVKRFRNTVLTAQQLLKTAYEQRCQDVEQKIAIAMIPKKGMGHCSTLSLDQHTLGNAALEEVQVKEEPIDIDTGLPDSGDVMALDPISIQVKCDPMTPLIALTGVVKGEIMAVNKVTSNTIDINHKNIPPPLTKTTNKPPETENKSKGADRNVTCEVRMPKDGELVMYGGVHAFTVKLMSEADLQAYRLCKRNARQFLGVKLKCETCIKGFKIQGPYEEHMKTHLVSAGNYPCSVCQQRFPSSQDMETHKQTHYTKYVCTKCKYGDTSLEKALSHYDFQHYVQKRECNICEAEFDTIRELRSHNRTAHATKIKCEKCGIMIRGNFTMKKHMARHTDGVPRVECNICKKSVQVTSLKLHMTHVHEDSPDGIAYCKPCDQMFKNERLYQIHVKKSQKHNPVETFKSKCEICGKWLGSNSSLKNHMATVHTDIGKYPCDKCDQTFKTTKSLKVHIRIKHAGVARARDAICEQCGKAFHTRKTLEEHMTIHTGARPHACGDCGATFGFKGALFTHRRLKHKVKRKKDL